MGMKFDLDLKICSLEKYNAEIVLRASVLCPGLNKHKCNDSDCGNIYSILVAKINRIFLLRCGEVLDRVSGPVGYLW